jgi:hypothetical protein
MSKMKLCKPFKTPNRVQDDQDHDLDSPFTRSDAPSPVSFPARRQGNKPGITLSRSAGIGVGQQISDRQTITSLETRARHLREALSHIQTPEKGYELEQLTAQWLAAGREITERLFALIPQPDRLEMTTDLVAFTNTGHGEAQAGWGMDHSGGGVADVFLTRAEEEYLASAQRNDNGDAVDAEGNLLLPETTSFEEMKGAFEREAKMAEKVNDNGRSRGRGDHSRSVARW